MIYLLIVSSSDLYVVLAFHVNSPRGVGVRQWHCLNYND